MTAGQLAHLQRVKDEFTRICDQKYRKGQQEHEGNLYDKNINDLLDCAIDEAIDQVVYLLTIREQLQEIRT